MGAKTIEELFPFLPFVEVNPKTQPPFCVDGRKGERETQGPYPQALGGSFNFVVLKWLLEGGNFSGVYEDTFKKLKELGYPLGLHRDTHAHGDNAGCGFADNNRRIIETLISNSDEIWQILNDIVDLSSYQEVWEEVFRLVNQRNLDEIPTGEEIIKKGKNLGAEVQVLDGEHEERAAIVNLKKGLTLDVDNNQDHQVFNLDLWYVDEVSEKLGLNVNQVKLLSLGLYTATEMVLVEGKGKPRLPILINQ